MAKGAKEFEYLKNKKGLNDLNERLPKL